MNDQIKQKQHLLVSCSHEIHHSSLSFFSFFSVPFFFFSFLLFVAKLTNEFQASQIRARLPVGDSLISQKDLEAKMYSRLLEMELVEMRQQISFRDVIIDQFEKQSKQFGFDLKLTQMFNSYYPRIFWFLKLTAWQWTQVGVMS